MQKLALLLSYFTVTRFKRTQLNLAGKDVLVLGSAKNAYLPPNYKSLTLVCCNGSVENAIKLGMPPPSITVVDYELVDIHESMAKDVRSKVLLSGILSKLPLGNLVATQSNDAIGGYPEILRATYTNFYEISRLERQRIIDSQTNCRLLERDRKTSLCSTGGFAVAFAFYLGAKTVTISGFSFHKTEEPTSFDPRSAKNRLDTRSHSMADAVLFGLLTINNKKIISTEPDLLPVLQNYGEKGPEW